MTDGFRAEGRTTKKDTRGSSKMHFRALFCLPACSTGCLLWKKKTKQKHPSSSSCSSARPEGVWGCGGWGGVSEWVPEIFSLKCNELPAIFSSALSAPAFKWSIKDLTPLPPPPLSAMSSPSCLSVFHERLSFFLPPCRPPASAPPRPLACQSLGASEGARGCLSFPLLAVSGADRISADGECARTITLPAAPRPQMSNAVFDSCTSTFWVEEGEAVLG